MYPNPAREEFYLNFGLEKTGEPVAVTVSDLTGKTVMQDEFTNSAPQVSRRYNLAAVKAGIYLVQVKTPEGISVKKLIRE